MAESCNQAFGRYLKILRERRGLSLDDVRSLSQAFPEKLNKGYLSRCENGHQRLAFSKLIPLSRIYEVPSDVLVERMELDLELDRLGGPDTANLSFEQLRTAGRKATNDGRHWNGYGYMRDAITSAADGPVSPRYRDRDEQSGVAHMNCATAVVALGRTKLAYHEFTYLRESQVLGERLGALLLERLSQCERRFGEWEKSRRNADTAIEMAQRVGDSLLLGYAHSNRAILASEEGDYPMAREHYEEGYKIFKEAGLSCECARALNNIAQAYFDMARLRSARRAVDAAQRMAQTSGHRRIVALGKILLGQIEAIEGRPRTASQYFREATQLGRELNDRVLRFKAEYRLFELANRVGDEATARAVGRRLRRLGPALPEALPEAREFKKVTTY